METQRLHSKLIQAARQANPHNKLFPTQQGNSHQISQPPQGNIMST